MRPHLVRLAVVVLLGSRLLVAQSQPPVPVLEQHVMDFTNSLTYNEWRSLEDRLRRVKDTTSIHIAIVVIDRVAEQTLQEYAASVFGQNRLGKKSGEPGILIVVAAAQQQAAIELGPGLEEIVTRETADIIVEKEILPLLKQDNLYGGLAGGVLAMTAGVVGQYEGTSAPSGAMMYLWIVGGVLIAALVVFLIARKKSLPAESGEEKGSK